MLSGLEESVSTEFAEEDMRESADRATVDGQVSSAAGRGKIHGATHFDEETGDEGEKR